MNSAMLRDALAAVPEDSTLLKVLAFDPVVRCAIMEAERLENAHERFNEALECPGCHIAATWGGGLMLHMFECADYAALVDDADPLPSPNDIKIDIPGYRELTYEEGLRLL